MLDELAVARMDKTKPLPAQSPARGFTCVLCGVQQEPFTWRVAVAPGKPACTGCAADRGWTIL